MEVQVKITEILEPQSFLGKDGVTPIPDILSWVLLLAIILELSISKHLVKTSTNK